MGFLGGQMSQLLRAPQQAASGFVGAAQPQQGGGMFGGQGGGGPLNILQQLFGRMGGQFPGQGGQFPGQGQGVARNPIFGALGQQGGGGGFNFINGPGFVSSGTFGSGGSGGGTTVQGPPPINETFGFDQRPIADFNPTPVSPAQGGFQSQGGFGGSLIQKPQQPFRSQVNPLVRPPKRAAF